MFFWSSICLVWGASELKVKSQIFLPPKSFFFDRLIWFCFFFPFFSLVSFNISLLIHWVLHLFLFHRARPIKWQRIEKLCWKRLKLDSHDMSHIIVEKETRVGNGKVTVFISIIVNWTSPSYKTLMGTNLVFVDLRFTFVPFLLLSNLKKRGNFVHKLSFFVINLIWGLLPPSS